MRPACDNPNCSSHQLMVPYDKRYFVVNTRYEDGSAKEVIHEVPRYLYLDRNSREVFLCHTCRTAVEMILTGQSDVGPVSTLVSRN